MSVIDLVIVAAVGGLSGVFSTFGFVLIYVSVKSVFRSRRAKPAEGVAESSGLSVVRNRDVQ